MQCPSLSERIAERLHLPLSAMTGFLELCHIPGTGIIVHCLSVLLIEVFPQSKIVIPDEPATTKCPLHLLYLRWGRIDAKFITVFHYDSIQYFYEKSKMCFISPRLKAGGLRHVPINYPLIFERAHTHYSLVTSTESNIDLRIVYNSTILRTHVFVNGLPRRQICAVVWRQR